MKPEVIKGLQIPKEVTLSLYADDMVLHIRHPQKCLIFSSKWQDIKSTYKKKPETFLYTNNKHAEKGKHTPIHSSLEKKKISKNKSNQKGERTQQLKLQISEGKKNGSRHQMGNTKTSHTHH